MRYHKSQSCYTISKIELGTQLQYMYITTLKPGAIDILPWNNSETI